MTQGLENTISNGQGAKPHSAIEKGEIKLRKMSWEWTHP